jgi:hypothetical protein
MKYVESTDGTRGELYGCAVNALTYLEWVRIVNKPTAQDVMAVLEDEMLKHQVANNAMVGDLEYHYGASTSTKRLSAIKDFCAAVLAKLKEGKCK